MVRVKSSAIFTGSLLQWNMPDACDSMEVPQMASIRHRALAFLFTKLASENPF